MKTDQLDYELPSELIAQRPVAVRSDSRLLVVDRVSRTFTDSRFSDLRHSLRPGDCLVLNDTQVLPARFFAARQTGGRLEGLFLTQPQVGVWEVMIKGAGRLRKGEQITLYARDGCPCGTAQVLDRLPEGGVLLAPSSADGLAMLDRIGLPPLPPYIKRDADPGLADLDRVWYQTVYAQNPGAVAAPTAGLHFTTELLEQLRGMGIETAYLTLHVGAGTFKPVAVESLEDHPIHAERVVLSAPTSEKVNRVRSAGGRVVAVGTTSTRALESAAVRTETGWQVGPFEGQTRLFITPGYVFRMVDGLITNFHLTRSTLLALVAAFAGLELTLAAYRHAVRQGYRFYSYGDAMLVV
jgi:S-adenosylmethionine:tRNA ribosyltransferase-isomerase